MTSSETQAMTGHAERSPTFGTPHASARWLRTAALFPLLVLSEVMGHGARWWLRRAGVLWW